MKAHAVITYKNGAISTHRLNGQRVTNWQILEAKGWVNAMNDDYSEADFEASNKVVKLEVYSGDIRAIYHDVLYAADITYFHVNGTIQCNYKKT
jgi:hypothetical protein